jgi:hypothetical protein
MSGIMLALVIVVVLAAIVIVAVLAVRQSRTRKLKRTFGPEYDRTVRDAASHADAEAELESRRDRREQFNIRPLSPDSAARYDTRWREVQAQFVDAPETCLREADILVVEVMRDRGYPIEEFNQRAADISVDHPHVVENYRAAHEVSSRKDRDSVTTDDRRFALQHYRDLFMELLGPRQEIAPQQTEVEANSERPVEQPQEVAR